MWESGEESVSPHQSRSRKMTEKGLEYTIGMKMGRLINLCKSLEKTMTICCNQMDDISPHVQDTFKKWIGLYDQFLEVNDDYQSLLTSDNLNDYIDNWFRPRLSVFEEFKNTSEKWICYNTKPVAESDTKVAIKAEDSVSQASRRSSTSKTSLASAKLSVVQRKAELAVKAETLKKRQALESEKLKLKQKEEELQLEEEVAISEAQADAIERLGSKSGSVKSVRRYDRLVEHFEDKSEISGAQSFCNSNSPAAHTDALLSVVQHLNKPKSDLDKFDGNPLRYQHFMRQFRSKVVNNCSSNEEKLNFLEQYTTGEAQQIVIGFSYMDPQKGYEAALKELESRYGDQDVIVDEYIKKVLSWPTIKADKPKDLDRFSLFLKECENAISSLNAIQILEYSPNMKKIVSKLPYALHDKWRNIVFNLKEKGERPGFSRLVKFVATEAKKSNDPTYGREALTDGQKAPVQSLKPQRKVSLTGNVTETTTNSNSETQSYTHSEKQNSVKNSGSSQASNSSSNKTIYDAFAKPCMNCKGNNHSLDSCYKVRDMLHDDKLSLLKSFGLCFGCLKPGHSRKFCRAKAICQVCKYRHPTILHIDRSVPTSHEPQSNNRTDQPVSHTSGQVECHTGAGSSDCTMAVIPVTLKSRDGVKTIKTYAFLDPGSNVSFCTEEVARVLGVSGPKLTVDMDTMGTTHKLKTYKIQRLMISNINGDEFIELPNVYTKDRLPVSRNHIPTSSDIAKWPHLKDLVLPSIDSEIGLLIGNNVPDAYSPLEIRTGPKGTPHGARSRLGWIVWNVTRDSTSRITANRIHLKIQDVEETRNLERLYQQSVNMDFPENIIHDKTEFSQEDHIFMYKVQSSMKHQRDGHYEIALPFRNDEVALPDNFTQAVNRLSSLQKKLNRNPSFREDYVKFMTSLMQNGYAEEVPSSELPRNDGRVWYLPHHGVYHPKKPNKLRVVFDCAAVYGGTSLNSNLIQGPDLINSLFGILIRFRQHAVAVMADIESMYHQVHIPKNDQDCLRFLWWPDGNINKEPTIYRMVVHLFGAVSSPACCNFALHQTAADQQDEYPEACHAIKHNFYVDDFLKSVCSNSEAIKLVGDLSTVCSKGGFHLTKWVSNSSRVLEQIPEEERAKGTKDLSLKGSPMERALGICWNIQSDTLGFKIDVKQALPTRRNMLSLVSSIFDPLGMVSPFVLPAKILLQELCRINLSWDEEIIGTNLQIWLEWLSSLPKLEEVSFPRCYIPPNFGEICLTQIHYFSDASTKGYGVVAYLRLSNTEGRVHCQLLVSKARVAPLKNTTIPRMELTAATVAVKLHHKIIQELDITTDLIFFWTDSMTVLRYIANETSRYHTFVANRIRIIRDGSSVTQWRYVPSECNPGDFVSRGLSVESILTSNTWINGPSFLWKSYPEWIHTEPPALFELSNDDPEVKKKVHVSMFDTHDTHLIDGLFNTCSSWMKLKRVVGWILTFMDNLRFAASSQHPVAAQTALSTLPLETIHRAEVVIIKHVQQQYYSTELHDLSSASSCVKPSSSLYKLDPFIMDGIVRVGGRLARSRLPYESKHQILIPQKSLLAVVILEEIHRNIGHLGKNSMITELRKLYWIPKASTLVRGIMSRCVICAKYRARTQKQQMADLPEQRLVPDKPPFTHVGMDYFGPFETKRGRSLVKRYGVIFSCLTSRAVHLEVAQNMDTDSCINAIRRFVSRRGQVESITSDNGTNLVGAERELRSSMADWNQSHINKELQRKNIKWTFNTPTASQFGGVWERIIRSVRKIMHGLMHEQIHHLTDDGLSTLFCEIESILNSRPITRTSNDVNDLDALTPNHILTMRTGQNIPCGVFEESDCYVRRRWRHIQYLSDIFWRKWSREYLSILQERQKCETPQRNITADDLVMFMDTPRNAWTMAKVLDVIKGRRGLVRSVHLKTPTGTLTRPVHKLVLLLEADHFNRKI